MALYQNCSEFKTLEMMNTQVNGSQNETDDPRNPPVEPNPLGTLSERFPNDSFPGNEPSLLFHSNFENDFAGWDSFMSYSGMPSIIENNPTLAHAGNKSFKATFTLAALQSRGSASVRTIKQFNTESDTVFFRFYSRFTAQTARPHHWVGACAFSGSECPGGNAGLRPPGDSRFSSTVDIDGENKLFFYTYWHQMRSGRCNDGSVTPGCAGDQGRTYYYGNTFRPANQQSLDLTQWNCYEFMVKENTIGQWDGSQAMWVNGNFLGEFTKDVTHGEWLRANFYTEGEWGTDPVNNFFEGYNFRSAESVRLRSFKLEFYQQQDTLTQRRADTPVKGTNQTMFFDDVVIATERIGCMVR